MNSKSIELRLHIVRMITFRRIFLDLINYSAKEITYRWDGVNSKTTGISRSLVNNQKEIIAAKVITLIWHIIVCSPTQLRSKYLRREKTYSGQDSLSCYRGSHSTHGQFSHASLDSASHRSECMAGGQQKRNTKSVHHLTKNKCTAIYCRTREDMLHIRL